MKSFTVSPADYQPICLFWPVRRTISAKKFVLACGLALLQACNGGDTTAPSVAHEATPINVVVGTAIVGNQLSMPVAVNVKDGNGRPVSGQMVRWTPSGNGSTASASSMTDASGVAVTRWTLGTSAGSQQLTARVSGIPDVVFAATALADRPATLSFTGPVGALRVLGDSVALGVVALDQWGNVSSSPTRFSLGSPSDVVSVDGNYVIAKARGQAVVVAVSDTAVAELVVTVAPSTPAIDRLSSDTVAPGLSFSILGENFPTVAGDVAVTVGGYVAVVTSVSPSRIDAVLPAGSVPCQAASRAPMVVSVGGSRLETTAMLRVARQISLMPGESVNVLDAAGVRCTEISPPAFAPGSVGSAGSTGTYGGVRAKYVLAVINTSATAAATAGFELRGTGGGSMSGKTAVPITAGGSIAASNAGSNSASSARASSSAATRSSASMRAELEQSAVPGAASAETEHGHFLDSQRDLNARYGSPVGAWRAKRNSASGIRAAGMVSSVGVGDTVPMKALYSSCSRGTDILARVVYSGSKAVVLEDVASPRAGQMDDQYRAIGEEFDRVQYPLLQGKIGDPLAMNESMGGDGRVTMLFTRFVNDSLPGIAGYVTACNFYPKSMFAASNEDEIFYARTANAQESPDEWRRTIRSTVIHEGKHLASFAERIVRGNSFEESWLEESTARIAEELYSRTFAGGGSWKGNVGYGTVNCEVVRCDSRPLMMWKHFSVLQQYMSGVDTLTPIGAAATGDFTYYASGWSLVRWAADHYAADEGQWLKDLVKGGGGQLSGLAGLALRTGHSADEMLADWALANAVDDLPGFTPKREALTFPSWDTPAVMNGLATSFPMMFVASPLKARAMSFGAFALPVSKLRSFSSSYFSFEGAQAGSQLIELRGEGGTLNVPGTLRVAIVRVE